MDRILAALRSFGLPRFLIVSFLALIWLVGIFVTERPAAELLTNSLVRAGMNGILVLALVPMVRAGAGLNFGLPLGIVCGLLAAVVAMEMNLGARAGFAASIALALPVAAVAGLAYALLLERVRGEEMMVGLYTGFAAVAAMSIVWLVAPFRHPEVIWPLGGKGARTTITLASALAESPTKEWRPAEVRALLAVWLGAALLLAAFDRTRLGLALAAVGQNERFALSAGIPVARVRRLGVVLSTVLAAAGIVVFSHAYGFIQLYKAPLLMALPAVAALLLGGASTARATVGQAVLGTLLFESLRATSQPVVNELVRQTGRVALENVPEVARLIIMNGVILYALTRKG